MSSQINAVELKGVYKTFKSNQTTIEALKNINLDVKDGEFLVIAGENGSGKTTLLKIISGLLLPDKGKVFVYGIDVAKKWKKIARYIGIVFASDRGLYWKLTGIENLEVFGGLYGLKRSKARERGEYYMELLGLSDAKDRLVEEYSTGMRKKLMLAKALIHDPRIVILDEVLSGIDPRSYKEIVSFLERINRKEGKTVILVTHVLHDLPEHARVILMKNGEIIYSSFVSDLKKERLVRITAEIFGKSIEKVVEEDLLNKTVFELVSQGASNIKIYHDDIYSIIRRKLEK